MKNKYKTIIGFSGIFFLLLYSGSFLSAQQAIIDLTAKIQIDPLIKYGKLANGFTYYIRHNEKPEKRADFFLVVNAGAILEDDNQDGLAHFCEHMAFNGTKNFKKHDIIYYLQSIGMKFGPEINAFTSTDVTNYMLQDVPLEKSGNLDTALSILYDWASGISFENEEIDKERGVIHEEWRTGRSAERRMDIKSDKVLFKDSKYAVRSVIGDTNIIDKAPYETLKRFYYDWYRPDLQAIVAIGDFDINEMENRITTLFSNLSAIKNPKERKEFEVPDHLGTLIDIQKDKEAENTNVKLYYKHNRKYDKSILSYLRTELIIEVFSSVLNARLDELTIQQNPPFSRAHCYYGDIVRTKDAFVVQARARNNQALHCLKAVLDVNDRLIKHGFTSTEFERAKKEILVRYEKSFKERKKVNSMNYAWAYYSHFLSKDPIQGIEFKLDFVKKILPNIMLEEVNRLTDLFITKDNCVVLIWGPDKENVSMPDEKQVRDVLEGKAIDSLAAYKDEMPKEPLFIAQPKPSKVIIVKKDELLNFTEWSLENGAKIIIKETDFKEDEISFTAFSHGGASLIADKNYISSLITSEVVGESGLAGYSKVQLQKYNQDKIVWLNAWLTGTTEEFRGSSSVKDFETLLQMLYLKFTQPRFDTSAFYSYLTRMKSFYENRSSDPDNALFDTVAVTMSQYHFRGRPWTVEILNEARFTDIMPVYKDRFQDASDFIFLFVGNIQRDIAKPLIEKYIGGIPSSNRNELWKDWGQRFPKGVIKKEITRKMEVKKASNMIIYTGEFEYNLKNRLLLSAINDILSVRYVETIREEQSGTYGVSVRSHQQKYPYQAYRINISFDCAPERAAELKTIVYNEIEQLRINGPKQNDLDNFKENKLKERAEKLKENYYWLDNLKHLYYNNENVLDNKYEEIIKSLTIEDIKKATNEFIKDENHVEVTLLPEK
ncbi:MAG: insulinase family protein [Bacteroidia bacterium]|nr:insulinase family protein [Bacteroidia bacterium]